MGSLPNYDTWKAHERSYQIEFRATGQATITLDFDIEDSFCLDSPPRSHDEYYQEIKDAVVDAVRGVIQQCHRQLKEKYAQGSALAYEEMAELEVTSARGSWV